MSFLKQALLLLLDTLLVVSAGIILVILVSGGGVFHIGAVRVSATHARNLIAITTFLVVLRGYGARAVPFLGVRLLEFRKLPERCVELFSRLHAWLRDADNASARRVVVALVLVSAVIKLLNSWFYYGFFSGDDVEIHEMTLSTLLGWTDWQAWNLRNAFYPMAFIYPAQALVHGLGVQEEALLVFAGRTVVVLFSLLSIILVYRVAKDTYGSVAVGICAVSLFAASHVHNNFASTVLPRVVAATFVLLSVWLLVRFRQSPIVAIASGLLLGIGSAIRFSEALFIGCVVLYLLASRRVLHGFLVGIASVATAALVVGVADQLYWGTPFSSLLNLYDYTIRQAQSSRGYQPVWFYLTTAGSWGNYLMVGLLVYAAWLREWRGFLLAGLPIAILSILPHKEFRYLVPVLPFACIVAGFALWTILTEFAGETSTRKANETPLVATVLGILVVVSLLFEIDGYRFRRYESAVDAARYVREQPAASSVGVEQLWRAGGRIYLWRVPIVRDISFDRRDDRDYIRNVLSGSAYQYVALNTGDVERFGYEELLGAAGYQEIPLVTGNSSRGYRLYEQSAERH